MRNFLTGLIVFGVILVAFLLQLIVINEMPLFGAKANIGIVLIVALSILCGKQVGISVGIVYGVISDVLFGKAFGIYTLLFFLIGFFCGGMSRGFSKENKNALIMITAGTTLIFEVIAIGIFKIVFNYELEIILSVKQIGLEMLYNMLISRMLFSALTGLSEIINKGKRSYYLL